LYQEGSLSGDVVEVFNCMRTRFLPGLLALLAEAGGSALPIADSPTPFIGGIAALFR